MNRIILLLLLNCFLFSCTNTEYQKETVLVGVSEKVEVYNANLFEDSYLFAIENGSKNVYLLNKQGFKVKEWMFDDLLGNDIQILPNGKLLGMFKSQNPIFSFGGFGGIIKIINTDGTTHWQFELASNDFIAHHDLELLPNGNIVFLVWERISLSDALQKGINASSDVFTEKIVEINPSNNQIVWEWRSIDHIIQDQFPGISTFGDISQNPQLININYNIVANGDYMHANGITFDAEKDVLYVSINFYSEIWAIDHSTSTMQAASNFGGNYNKGGDLIYRFGNPEVYNNTAGQRLFYNNHSPNFLKDNLPGAGNILVYNNGGNIGQSSVYELKMPDPFKLLPNNNNEPTIIWSFTDANLFSDRISGAERLENGNTLITEGDYGFWEVTPSKEIVWKYKDAGTTFWRSYIYKKEATEIKALGL